MLPQNTLMSSLPVLVLLFTCASLTSACFRRSTPSSQPATTTPDPSHKVPCTALEASAVSCLNGGQCFAVPSYGGLRETGCRCTSQWMGQRCELVDPGVILALHERNVRTAHIAAGVSVAVLALFAALVLLFVCARFKRKTWRHMENYECSVIGMKALCNCQALTPPHKTQHKTDSVRDSELGNNGDVQTTTQFLPNSKGDISRNNNNLTQDKNGNVHISSNSGMDAS